MGLCFKRKQLQHFYTSVTMHAQAVRWNRTLHTYTVVDRKRICRKYWYLVWKYYFVFCSIWSRVSILNYSNCVGCWCSLVYLSIAQMRHFSSERKNCFSLIQETIMGSAIWLWQWGQNHPLTAATFKYWCAPRNSHASHLHRPFMLHTTLNSKMHLYKDHGIQKKRKNQAYSIWEDTRIVFSQQIRQPNWTAIKYCNNFRLLSWHWYIYCAFVEG